MPHSLFSAELIVDEPLGLCRIQRMGKNVKELSPEKIRMLSASPSLTNAEADSYGDAFFDAGMVSQALLFYDRSRNPDKYNRVKEYAIEQGDAFLLYGVEKVEPESIKEREWRQAGENALERKQYIFARDCFERAEEPDRAQEAHEAYLQVIPTETSETPPHDPE
jgi:hypothetical protein